MPVDSSECSVYRYEAVEEIVKAMDCQVLNEQVQEQSARALLILAGHFSYTGEPVAETWLLKQAGFDENSLDASSCNKVAFNNFTNLVCRFMLPKWSQKQLLCSSASTPVRCSSV